MTFTEEEFKEWKENPMTRVLCHYLECRIQQKREAWSRGEFTSSDLHSSATLNAEAIGNIGGWQDVLELNFEQLQGVIYEE